MNSDAYHAFMIGLAARVREEELVFSAGVLFLSVSNLS